MQTPATTAISAPRIALLTTLAMLAFAGNSLLCRQALSYSQIDAASFTSIRLISGAIVLGLIVSLRGQRAWQAGGWLSAFALFAYAAAFSFAYVSLTAGTGALLLFGSVQVTMIGYGLWSGERMNIPQTLGWLGALAGLAGLLWPGLAAPPLFGSLLMIAAGVAWGVYSLRGRGVADATATTAGNFLRSVPFALALSLLFLPSSQLDGSGVAYAAASGALTSGLGYVIWYTAVRGLNAARAAAVQLSVPVITAVGGVLLLGEWVTLRLVLASAAILGGIALVIRR
jgi:drug/metabolite transporter (DMT)-like permease